MSTLIWVIVGIVAGAVWMDLIHDYRKQKTLEQIDLEMRKDLERYRNMSQSLLADVKYWRDRYHTLQKIKEKK
jgi:uncharacterized membrane-anchored protein YhcB (DUF1043 family)